MNPGNYQNLDDIAEELRASKAKFILLFGHNGIGKTRLSGMFKDKGKITDPQTGQIKGDTLYFNAFTEDLFWWDNDLANDTHRKLKMNTDSKFFSVFKDLDMENRIRSFLNKYVRFDFEFGEDRKTVSFELNLGAAAHNDIKISRGEENLFIWCTFLAVCQAAIDGNENYQWVKYIYIDDPISSLDENNTIRVATELAELLKNIQKDSSGNSTSNIERAIISTHHSLFFNIMYNELKGRKAFFIHKTQDDKYDLREIGDTPFFHHLGILKELKDVAESGNIKTYHFNALRSVLEQTAAFFGLTRFSECLPQMSNTRYSRALNLLSHGKYSVFTPIEMLPDNKDLFREILNGFLDKYPFKLDEINNITQ